MSVTKACGLFVIIGLVLVNTGSAEGPETACSPERRSRDLQTCLAAIGELAQDSAPFWFGSSFFQRCPDGPQPSGGECIVGLQLRIPQSIVSLMFDPGTFNTSTLDRYLNVVYTSKPGRYTGCGNVFTTKETLRFTADPLSEQTIDCWDARETPEVTWVSSPGEPLFALLVIDVAYGFIHAITLNIPGSDISKADVAKPYNGPLNPYEEGNVYAFLLFKQSGRTELDQSVLNGFPGQQFNATEFMIIHGLSGPVGMSWILAHGDPYSAERQRQFGIVDACPVYVANALSEQGRPFIPSDPKFEVLVNVTFFSEEVVFISCCKVFHYDPQTVLLNPLGDMEVNAGVTRATPKVKLTRTQVFFNPATGFAEKRYTLVMVDPDVAGMAAGSNEMPLLHWLIINIPGGNVSSGQEVLRYMGPSPPDDKPHYYYFLLYEQTTELQGNSHVQFAGQSCPETISTRCQFDVTRFAATRGLSLVGASWMVSRKNEFVRYSRVSRGMPEEEICAGVPGYKPNCTFVYSGGESARTSLDALILAFSCLFLGIMNIV